MIDETGNTYGDFVVTYRAKVIGAREAMWECECSGCGDTIVAKGSHLRSGSNTRCHECIRLAYTEVTCNHCNTQFDKRDCDVSKYPTHYCSSECFQSWMKLHKSRPYRSQESRDREKLKRRKWSFNVFQGDSFKCLKCGIDSDLNGHHIYSFRDYTDLRFNISNGVTMCSSCHTDFHKTYGYTDFLPENTWEYLDV
jgi:5-methylcytosine-specific restriction endonuclease McrA